MSSIHKLISVIEKGEELRAIDITNRVGEKYYNGVTPEKVINSIRNALPTLSRKGFLKKTIIDKRFYYALTETSNLYYTQEVVKHRTQIRQVGCYVKGELLCSRNVQYKSQIVKFEDACKEHFKDVSFEYFNESNSIPNILMPSKNNGFAKKINAKKALSWYENKTLGSIENLSKKLNLPLPNTKEQILEFYTKAISL